MTKVLEALANDNLSLGSLSFKRNSAYGKAMQQLCDFEKQLAELLNEPEQALLTELQAAQSEVNFLTSTNRFVYGYRLGALMMIEVFTGSDVLTDLEAE